MTAKTKRKPKAKAKKVRLPASELGRMVQKVATLDRTVAKISAGIDGMEKQLRLITIAIICLVVAIGYVNYTKADTADQTPQTQSKRR